MDPSGDDDRGESGEGWLELRLCSYGVSPDAAAVPQAPALSMAERRSGDPLRALPVLATYSLSIYPIPQLTSAKPDFFTI